MHHIYETLVNAVRAEYLSGEQDYPWIIGMLARSDILVAKVSLPLLERLAAVKIAEIR